MPKKKPSPEITKKNVSGKRGNAVEKPTDRLTKSISIMRHHTEKLENFSLLVRDKTGFLVDRSKLIQIFSEIVDEYGEFIDFDGVVDSADLRQAIIQAIKDEKGERR